ncbi:MAG: hypothetical protein JXR94_11650, partial [Candidatus Hydrogenedentes bacterium]|nr:hypothetical protein [Candidatus Hydrogenedentota bacterium]
GSQQRHALPTAPAAMHEFARRFGYASGPSFMAEYDERTAANRGILERFLAAEGSGHRWLNDLFHPLSDGETGLARLRQLGFAHAAKARDEFVALYSGAPDRPHTAHTRQRFAAAAPALIAALSRCADPDGALVRLSRILANLRAPGAVYEILHTTPELSEYLVKLVNNSEFLTDILVRDPGLFDTFGSHAALAQPLSRDVLEETVTALSAAYEPEAALYRLHAGETLRIGMRELFCDVDVFQIGRELSLLAEVCLTRVLDKAYRSVAGRHGVADAPFAVIGLGKLGGAELGYGSDLDLLFVYDGEADFNLDVSPVEYFTGIASHTIRSLKEPTRYGTLYDIDARLRPDGNKGVLTVSLARMEEYYRHEAQAWERLALAKARAVGAAPSAAPAQAFAEQVARHARDFAFGRPLTPEDIANIEAIRAKIVASASPLDLKKGEGGIAEIEFAVRMLQARCASGSPELKRSDLSGALDILARIRALDPESARTLLDAYLFLRRIENRIRMKHGRHGSCLPESAEEQADLAARLAIPGDLAGLVRDHQARVHAVYLRTLETCGTPREGASRGN